MIGELARMPEGLLGPRKSAVRRSGPVLGPEWAADGPAAVTPEPDNHVERPLGSAAIRDVRRQLDER